MMKNRFWIILVGVLALCLLGGAALAEVTVGDWKVALDGESASITGYTGSDTEITIPGTVTVDGTDYTVTAIGTDAFYYCSNLTSVTIPGSVTSIGLRAFHECTGLASVAIPGSVTTIGSNAFFDCASLTGATIPDSVTHIGDGAFSGCSSLTSVTIPWSVTDLGDGAFCNCASLTAIHVSAENTAYCDENGVVFSKDMSELVGVPAGMSGAYSIPGSVTRIGGCAFMGCASMTSVTIPDNVSTIGYQAFYGCSGLTSVIIPGQVVSVNSYAFMNCTGLESVTLSDNMTSISNGTFASCTSLMSVTIPGSVKTIGLQAFINCTSLTSITIPDGVETIGMQAFVNCTSLTSVTLPNSVTSVGPMAFVNCSSLTDVYYGGTAEQLAQLYSFPNTVSVHYESESGDCGDSVTWALYHDGLLRISGSGDMTSHPWTAGDIKGVVIENGVTSIGDDAFNGCTSLTSVTIPGSVTSIGYRAFNVCSGLMSVTISDGVTTIGNAAFADCTSLSSVTIPDSVTSIGVRAFSGCSLTSVTIPQSVTLIDGGAFSNCASLTAIHVSAENTAYCDEDGVLFSKNKSVLVGVPAGMSGAYSIPESVKRIESRAFEGCASITGITLPDGLMHIGNYAFSGCSSLTSVIIPDKVTSIAAGIFMNCTGLESVTIPDNVIIIDSRAFADCRSLMSVTIPSRVATIGSSAFINCISLTSITLPDSVTRIDGRAFEACTSLTDVFYDGTAEQLAQLYSFPATVSVHYKSESGACGNGVTWALYHDGLLKISGSGDMTSHPWTADDITRVVIENGVTSISDYAFNGCTSLTSVAIPASVTSIGAYAFCGCGSLTSVAIPDSVTSIGDHAFDSCGNLTVYCSQGSAAAAYCTEHGILKVISGTCGSNLTWTLDDNGLLTIRGLGAMDDFSPRAPWDTAPASVVIENGVTGIGEYAFYGCSSLTSVTIPNGVTGIGEYAYYGCSSLTGITIPASVTSIGDHAFDSCGSLTVYCLQGSAAEDYCLANGILFKAFNGTCGSNLFWALDDGGLLAISGTGEMENFGYKVVNGLGITTAPWGNAPTSIVIENGVTGIGECAFRGCTSLMSVTIPNSVTGIGNEAFAWCSGLTHVTIPGSVTSIGEKAFSGCSGLTSLMILDGVTSIGDEAFVGCGSLSSVTIPGSVASTGLNAFNECGSLTSVTIQNGVTSISPFSFFNCSSLTSVSIPYSVTHIGAFAFYGCSSLTSITIPGSVTNIAELVFENCTSLTDLYYCGSEDDWGQVDKQGDLLPDGVQVHFIPCFTVTVYNGMNGTASASPDYCPAGTTVTLSAVPDAGFGLVEWQITPDTVTVTNNQFVMPASDVTVVPVFEEGVYPITARQCTVTALNGDGTPLIGATPGTELFIIWDSSNEPEGMYWSERFSVNGVTLPEGTYSFTMPQTAVTVAAEYLPQESVTINLSNGPTVAPGMAVYGCGDMEFDDEYTLYRMDINGDGAFDLKLIPEDDGDSVRVIPLQGLTALKPSCTVDLSEQHQLIGMVTFLFNPVFGQAAFTLPGYLTAVEASAFEGDTAITIVDASHCESIGADAFKGCTGLTRIRLPQACQIAPSAFDGCGLVFVFGPASGQTEGSCAAIENCVFIAE